VVPGCQGEQSFFELLPPLPDVCKDVPAFHEVQDRQAGGCPQGIPRKGVPERSDTAAFPERLDNMASEQDAGNRGITGT
jgi:hypothetical protein